MAAIVRLKNRVYHEPEDEITFDSFIRFALYMFRILFFDFSPLDENASTWKRFVYHAKMVYVRISILAMFFCFISMIMYGVDNADDFVSAAAAIPNSTITLLIALKTLIVFLRKKDIWDIFHEMKEMFERRAGCNRKYEVKKHLDNYHMYISTYAAIYGIFIFPIMFPVVPYLIDGSMTMSVSYWFPFNVYQMKTFPIYLFWTDWNGVNMSTYILAADAILYSLMTVIAMEFDVLKIDLMNLKFVREDQRAVRVAELTDHHNRLMDISDKLQQIFDMIFLYSVVGSSLVMCIIAFELSLATADASTIGYFMPFFFMVVGMVYLLCVFGQKLIDASESVAEGIYDCGWEDFDDNVVKKHFILILLRAQRTKKFTAMNFAQISLSTFTTVMTTTGSYFSLVRNVYNGE